MIMTPEQFHDIRRAQGLTLSELGALLGYEDERTLRRMEAGDRPVPRPVAVILRMMETGELPERFRDPSTPV
jgi:transcriptional regulator with XRE-family HTH domain